VVQPPAQYADYVSHDHVAFETLQAPEQINLTDDDLIVAMKATSDPDTLYLWEAQKEPDFAHFQEAMQKEMDGHTDQGNWGLQKRSSLPTGATVLPVVCALKESAISI
jgi:hypothetical protein